jgi:hypothetical protein
VEKAEKSAVLDEFCQNTGYNRKYAITLLRGAGKTQLRRIRQKQTVKVKITAHECGKRLTRRFTMNRWKKAALSIRDFFRHPYGRRMAPMIRVNLKALSAEFNISREAQEKPARVGVPPWSECRAGNGNSIKPGKPLHQARYSPQTPNPRQNLPAPGG